MALTGNDLKRLCREGHYDFGPEFLGRSDDEAFSIAVNYFGLGWFTELSYDEAIQQETKGLVMIQLSSENFAIIPSEEEVRVLRQTIARRNNVSAGPPIELDHTSAGIPRPEEMPDVLDRLFQEPESSVPRHSDSSLQELINLGFKPESDLPSVLPTTVEELTLLVYQLDGEIGRLNRTVEQLSDQHGRLTGQVGDLQKTLNLKNEEIDRLTRTNRIQSGMLRQAVETERQLAKARRQATEDQDLLRDLENQKQELNRQNRRLRDLKDAPEGMEIPQSTPVRGQLPMSVAIPIGISFVAIVVIIAAIIL